MVSIHCLTQKDDLVLDIILIYCYYRVIKPIAGEYQSYIVRGKGEDFESHLKVLNLKDISNESINKFKEDRSKYLNDLNHVDEQRSIHLTAYQVMLLIIPHSCDVLSNENFDYQFQHRFNILDNVCESLVSLNKNNLCHGRLTPSNITIHNDGYRLRNYGLFSISHIHDLSYDEFSYLAPEVIKGKECNISSDIWSFGCIVYNLLTGRRLFHSSNVKNLANDIIKGRCYVGENECNEKEKKFIKNLVIVENNERIKINNLKENLEKIKNEKFEPDSDNITLHYIEQMAEHNMPIVDEEKLAVIGQKGIKQELRLFRQPSNVTAAPSEVAMKEEKKEEEIRLLDQVINRFNDLEAGDKKDYFFGLLVNLAFKKIYFAYIKEKIRENNPLYNQILRCLKFNDFKPEEFDRDRIITPTITLELTKRDGNNNNNNNNNNNIDEDNLALTKLFTKILPELCYLNIIELLHTDKETTDKILKYITNNIDRDNLKRFKKLKLNGSYASKDSIKIFSDVLSSSKHKNMKILYFENNELGDDGITYLVSKSCHLTDLEELYISSNDITSKGLNILTNSLKDFKHLDSLSIGKNKQIDKNSIRRLIKGLRHCPYIEFLCFSELSIDDEVIEDLVNSMNQHLLKQLVMLILNNNQISDKGAKLLINCLGKTRADSVCPKMGILDLNSNDKMKNRNITSCVFGKEKAWYEFSS